MWRKSGLTSISWSNDINDLGTLLRTMVSEAAKAFLSGPVASGELNVCSFSAAD